MKVEEGILTSNNKPGWKITGPKFTKAHIQVTGKWAHYVDAAGERHFLARFRTGGIKGFVNHLIKHHTPEEYLGKLEAGGTPIGITRETGYLLPHIKRWLKQAGYPATTAGYAAWKAAGPYAPAR